MAPATRKSRKVAAVANKQEQEEEEPQQPQEVVMEELDQDNPAPEENAGAEEDEDEEDPEADPEADPDADEEVEEAGEQEGIAEEEDPEEEAEDEEEEEERDGEGQELQQQQHEGGEGEKSITIGVKDEVKPQSEGTKSVASDGEKDDTSPAGGKIFIGGVTWETTAETLQNHFKKYGEIIDSVIMKNRKTGHPRGFGFVTFSDPSVCDKVLADSHVIDGRTVEAKRTVPREKMSAIKGPKTKKLFVGGLTIATTEEELKNYFAKFGKVVEHQIMQDHGTGRSRGFGFVTFDNEQVVEDLLVEGRMHEIGGKQVEIKKAEPKRAEPPPFRGGKGSSGSFAGRGGSGYSTDMGFYGSYNMGDSYYGGGYNSRGGRGGGYPYGGAYSYGGGPYGYADFNDSYGRYGYNYSGYGYDYGSGYSGGGGGGGRGYGGGSGRYHPYGR